MDFSEDEYSGAKELLQRDIVAFFASRNPTNEARSLALRWAEEISQTNKVVISGFHSSLEREVLDILLKNGSSVIVGLGRSLYRKIPSFLQQAYDERRLLFISFSEKSRHSESGAQLRNWAIAKLSQTIIFAPFEQSSMLSTMHYTFTTYHTDEKIIKILE